MAGSSPAMTMGPASPSPPAGPRSACRSCPAPPCRLPGACSSASASRIRMPARAAAPVPAISAAGVASPRAQGQAITSTDTAGDQRRRQKLPPISHQPSQAASAQPSTTGTNTAATRSTSRCTGALCDWAPSTRAMMRAKRAVCADRRRLHAQQAGAVDRAAGDAVARAACPPAGSRRSAGSRRPGSVPDRTRPSVGKRSPGRTTTMSPSATAATGSSISPPSRSTRAVSGRSASRARMAAPVARRVRASSQRPNNTRVMTTAAASK